MSGALHDRSILRKSDRRRIERARPDLREPPPGPPWDDPLNDAPLCFVDLEMTGLHISEDRVIEICIERVRGQCVEAHLTSLVRPDGGAFGNAHIHGIHPSELAHAPSFTELVPQVEALLENSILVAHAAMWDVAFLEAEMARAGRPRCIPHYLDTLPLSRRTFAFSSHKLGILCSELGIPRGRAHRAPDDVAALRQVFERIVKALEPISPRALWHVRVGQRHARPDLIAAAKAALDREVVVTVRYRPAHRGVEELAFRVTAVRTDLDPPRVLGYQLPSRSRRELRADRILAIVPSSSGDLP